MTIHQIECFLEAAKTLNFTEAASRLYISQQGLSRQIASLEKELELRLFDRTTRDVRLTRSGELLLWRWKDIPAEIKDSVDMAREEGERAKSRINLAVVGMNGIIERAGSLLADYMAIDPDTEFEINEFTCIKDMTNGNPDLMMTVSFLPTHEQLRERYGVLCIGKLPLYYVLSRNIGFKEFYHNYGERLKMFPLPNKENQVSANVIVVWRKENEKRFENFIKYLKKLYN